MKRLSATLAAASVVALVAGMTAASAAENHRYGPGDPRSETRGHDVAEFTGKRGPRGRVVHRAGSEGPSEACEQAMADEGEAPGGDGVKEPVPGMHVGQETNLTMKRHMEKMERHMEWMNDYMERTKGVNVKTETKKEPRRHWRK
jgi:hypothetical protein